LLLKIQHVVELKLIKQRPSYFVDTMLDLLEKLCYKICEAHVPYQPLHC
jgi:hypothetical protein